MESREVI